MAAEALVEVMVLNIWVGGKGSDDKSSVVQLIVIVTHFLYKIYF